MPSLLFSTKSFFRMNEKQQPSLQVSRHTTELENQLKQGSIAAAIRLAALAEPKHLLSTVTGPSCQQCDTSAGYYLTALRLVQQQDSVRYDGDMLELVWFSTQAVLEHGALTHPWFDLYDELRELSKTLKEDDHPLTAFSEGYRQAIQIHLYNCRARVQHNLGEYDKAISYYRKCVSIPSTTTFNRERLLQQSAQLTLQILETDIRPSLKSRTSSVSSGSSTSSRCATCGVEKRAMPVCARCKTQAYCSLRCLKENKLKHELECSAGKPSQH